jgi:hypothetical protein
LGGKLIDIHNERHEGTTKEAIAAADCDVLAELVTEKEYSEKGAKEASEWMEFTMQRLKTKMGKKLAKIVRDSRMAEWWEELKNEIRKKHGVPLRGYSRDK